MNNTVRVFLCETPRIGLRAIQEGDLDGEYPKWLNDPEVCRFNSHAVYPTTPAELSKYIQSLAGDRSRLVLAIVEKSQGRHIGNISLQNINAIYRSAELAILLGDRSCWGQGYGGEAAGMLLNHGFMKLNLHRIYCGTAEGNAGMRRLAEKLGMHQEGIRRQALFLDGNYCDLYEYGILKDEYFAR